MTIKTVNKYQLSQATTDSVDEAIIKALHQVRCQLHIEQMNAVNANHNPAAVVEIILQLQQYSNTIGRAMNKHESYIKAGN